MANVNCQSLNARRQAANDDLNKLRMLVEMKEANERHELNAQKYITGTRDFVLRQINNNYDRLEYSDYNNLKEYEKNYWNVNIMTYVKIYKSYSKFLDYNKHIVNSYKNDVLRRLNEKLPAPPAAISCETALSFMKTNGDLLKHLNSEELSSSWLTNVYLYTFKDVYYVIAEMKNEKYGFSVTKEYIFCDIPHLYWLSFEKGGTMLSNSFGERFNEFIKPNSCNCE